MERIGPLTGRVVPRSQRPDAPATTDTWWAGGPWSRFMGRVHGDDLSYLVIEDDTGRLCATAPLLMSTVDRGPALLRLPAIVGDEHVFGDGDRLSTQERAQYDELRRQLPEVQVAGRYPAIAVSTRGTDHGIAVAVDSPVSRTAVFEALPEILADVAEQLGCPSYGICHVTDEDSEILQIAGKAHGYQRVVLGAETILDLPAVAGRDEYVASLRSRRRTRLQRELTEYRAQRLSTGVRTGPDALTDDTAVLQARLRARHGTPSPVAAVRREFRDISGTVGDACVVLTAERDGRTLGFALCLYDEQRHELFVRSAGFDYDELADGCYLALIYGEVPLWAADNGVRRIRFGMSTYEAKRARGCTLQPMYGHLRFDGDGGNLLHRVAHWQSLGEQRRLAALGAGVLG